jgi:hypothetical protein
MLNKRSCACALSQEALDSLTYPCACHAGGLSGQANITSAQLRPAFKAGQTYARFPVTDLPPGVYSIFAAFLPDSAALHCSSQSTDLRLQILPPVSVLPTLCNVLGQPCVRALRSMRVNQAGLKLAASTTLKGASALGEFHY